MLNKKLFFDSDAFIEKKNKGFCVLISEKYCNWMKTSLTGLDILHKLDGTRTVEQVIKEIALEYKIPEKKVESDVLNFCEVALDHKLIFKDKKFEFEPSFDNKLRFIYLDITNMCDSDCIYCNKCTVSEKEKATFIKPEKIKKYLDKLFPTGNSHNTVINITGGEPLFHNHLTEIFKIISSYKCKIFLYTNGKLINEKHIDVFKKYNVSVKLSLDSHEKELNDKLRGQGSYDSVVNAAHVLSETGLPFYISTTLTKYNIDIIKKILSFIYNINACGIIINQRILEKENGEDLSEHFDYNISKYNEVDEYLTKRVSIINSWKNNKLKRKEKNKTKNIIYYKEKNMCGTNIFSLIPKKNCNAGVNEISIDINGNVFPCHALHVKSQMIGEIDDFINKKYKVIKVDDLEECKDCDYKIFCLGGCRAEAFYQTKNIMRKDSFCENRKKSYDKILWSPLFPTKKKENIEKSENTCIK